MIAELRAQASEQLQDLVAATHNQVELRDVQFRELAVGHRNPANTITTAPVATPSKANRNQ